MEKIASTMLDKAKQFVEANPQLVTNTLLAGGLGAVGGALLPTPKEDEDEPASDRVKRRLKNALIGATVVGGTGALLSNAAYNFGTAKLQRQLTPEEKSKLLLDKTQDTAHGVLTNPYTLGAATAGGGLYGQFAGKNSDFAVRKLKADEYIKGIRGIKDTDEFDAATKTVKKHTDALQDLKKQRLDWETKHKTSMGEIDKLTAMRDATTNQRVKDNLTKKIQAEQAKGTTFARNIADIDSKIPGVEADLATAGTKLQDAQARLRDLPAEGSGARGLRQWVSKNTSMDDISKARRAKLLQDAAGHITPGEAAKLAREYGINPLDAGLLTNKASRLANLRSRIWPWLRSNKRTALGAILAPAILGGAGYALGTSDGGKLTPQD